MTSPNQRLQSDAVNRAVGRVWGLLLTLVNIPYESRADPMDAEYYVGFRNIGKEHHGYSNTHNVLHVVHNHKWRHLDSVGSVLRVRPGFSVSNAKQMVSHSPGNLQRGDLLVPRVVQNLLPVLQCRSLRGPADNQIRGRPEVKHALDSC